MIFRLDFVFMTSKIFSFLFLVALTNTSQAQWWVDGGNLIWPHGDVSIKKNLIVSDSIYLSNSGKFANLRLLSYEEEGTIYYDQVLEMQTSESSSSDYAKFTLGEDSFSLFGLSSGSPTYTFSLNTNGALSVVKDGVTVSLEPLFKGIRLNNTVYVMTGSGDPEGTISALVGSLYLRSDGVADSCLYVKESGSSSTGWVAK